MTLDDLRKLEAAATEGPWEYDDDDCYFSAGALLNSDGLGIGPFQDGNGPFIAALRNSAPALLEFVARVEDGYGAHSSDAIYYGLIDLEKALAAIDTGKGDGG